jgi:hypothetical protein
VKVTGSGGVGVLVLEAEPGEDIVSTAVASLRASGAPFAWLVARGTLREALVESASRSGGITRAIEGSHLELASASGVWHLHDDTITLSGVIAREIDRGADVVAGRLAAAVAERVELVCFLATAAAPPPAEPRRAAPVDDSPPPPPAEPWSGGNPGGGSSGSGGSSGGGATGAAPAHIPPKPVRRAADEQRETYPEPGDRVTHFAFGECLVESSDGDRISIKQDKDGRVREVSLAMLRIDPPVIDAEGRKHYRLQRKN